jgi:hypothetical protein
MHWNFEDTPIKVIVFPSCILLCARKCLSVFTFYKSPVEPRGIWFLLEAERVSFISIWCENCCIRRAHCERAQQLKTKTTQKTRQASRQAEGVFCSQSFILTQGLFGRNEFHSRQRFASEISRSSQQLGRKPSQIITFEFHAAAAAPTVLCRR